MASMAVDPTKKSLVFAPLHDKPGRVDATKAFQPEAHAFCRALGLRDEVHLFDSRADYPERRDHVYRRLAELPPASLSVLAFFCHGWRDGIQTGFMTPHVGKLAAALKPVAEPEGLAIMLYACDAARDGDNDEKDDVQPGPGGDGGFADSLRDACARAGFRATVYAHAKEGHTTKNPFMRVFPPDEGVGGPWVIEPKSDLWRPWVNALRDTDLRFRFWRLTPDALAAELRGREAVA